MSARAFIILLTITALALLAFVLAPGSVNGPNDPRFVPGPPSSIPPYTADDYDWISKNPFGGGKFWLWTHVPGNFHAYLFDLEHHRVLGELLHGDVPVLCSHDGSRMLCVGPDSSITSFKAKALGLINKVLGGKLPEPNRTETFWILDVRRNSATMAGQLSQIPGSGSRWVASPSSRYGYTVPSSTFNRSFVLCDLDVRAFEKIPTAGEQIKGWWDDQRVLVESGINEFSLLDITTQKRRPLFSAASVNAFLTQAGLTNPPSGIGAFANWNGRDYDFYFGAADSINGLKNPDSYLLKADRAGTSLKVVCRNFRFRWDGQLDSAGAHYLYEGESGAPGSGGNGAVYLTDLTNGTTVTVVPPDNKGQYSIPRFYGNEVIYYKNRLLRRIQLDGSNDAPLFPGGP